MATMNISLPDALKQWASTRNRYGNASDYVRELIRRDQERTARLTHLQNLLDEGIASGVSPLSVEAVFANAKAKYDRQSTL